MTSSLARTWTLLALFWIATSASAQTLPNGFTFERVVHEPPLGEQLIGFEHLPDERILLLERASGIVRLTAAKDSTSKIILRIPNVEGFYSARGLLGIAVDPGWPTRPYIYVNYTHATGFQRIVRYTGTGDLGNPKSLNLRFGEPFTVLGDIPDTQTRHNAGTLRFGPDGMLYASLGDDGQPCEAQNLASPLGKILRLDVSELPPGPGGPASKETLSPEDNPYPDASGWQQLICILGLRNPFRFDIDPLTGELFVGGVGSSMYDEIHWWPGPQAGLSNCAWPQWEADQSITCCGDCGIENTFDEAIHAHAHGDELTAVIGGPVMRHVPTSLASFPPEYDGDYFYLEYFSGTLRRLQRSMDGWTYAPPVSGQPSSEAWATGLHAVSDLQLGPDGALYLLATGDLGFPGGLYRIRRDHTVTDAPSVASSLAFDVFPNPAREATTIVAALPAGSSASLSIHDAAGRLIRSLDTAGTDTPNLRVQWDGRDLRGRRVASGIYFARLNVSHGGVATLHERRITLVR